MDDRLVRARAGDVPDPCSAVQNSLDRLTINTLSAVHYAYGELPSARQLLEPIRKAILGEYATFRSKGQGPNFPLFTEHYQRQATKSNLDANLVGLFCECAQHYLSHIAPSLRTSVKPSSLATLWANVNAAGEYHSSHNHALGEYVLSGVFFVTAPDDLKDGEGLLVLERSLLPGVGGKFDLVYQPDAKVFIRPVPGWIVLFPPFVRHYVTPHSSRDMRISIAFNVSKDAVTGPSL